MLLSAGLASVAFSDRFVYYKTIETPYKKVAWNLHLINRKPENVEGKLVLLGSSLIQGGINDSILSRAGIPTLNMAVPHNGNDLNLYFFEKIQALKPKEVLWLKGKVPFTGLHKLSPLLYKPKELVARGQALNGSFIHYFFKRVKLSLEYISFSLFQGDWNLTPEQLDFIEKSYGFIPAPGIISQTVYLEYSSGEVLRNDEYYNLYLNDYTYQKEKAGKGPLRLVLGKRQFIDQVFLKSNFFRNVVSQEKFISKAQEKSKIQEIEFSKIYIPLLIDAMTSDNVNYRRRFFRKSSTDMENPIALPSYRFLNDKRYWSDVDHVSADGATLLTQIYSEFILARKLGK
jgi:hypothetical protein